MSQGFQLETLSFKICLSHMILDSFEYSYENILIIIRSSELETVIERHPIAGDTYNKWHKR